MREVGKRWHLGAIFSIGPVPFPLEKKVTLHTASQTCYILDVCTIHHFQQHHC